MLRYIELKSGHSDNGPAWIGRVSTSRSGRTMYFNGKAFSRISGGGVSGNYCDIETGDEYWISGVKKSGLDRHWTGAGKITIEAGVVDEYLALIGSTKLDHSKFDVSNSIHPTDSTQFHSLENEEL